VKSLQVYFVATSISNRRVFIKWIPLGAERHQFEDDNKEANKGLSKLEDGQGCAFKSQTPFGNSEKET
jgi:hypothetical protein